MFKATVGLLLGKRDELDALTSRMLARRAWRVSRQRYELALFGVDCARARDRGFLFDVGVVALQYVPAPRAGGRSVFCSWGPSLMNDGMTGVHKKQNPGVQSH